MVHNYVHYIVYSLSPFYNNFLCRNKKSFEFLSEGRSRLICVNVKKNLTIIMVLIVDGSSEHVAQRISGLFLIMIATAFDLN